MEVEILACPFCGWNHSLRQSRKRERGPDRDLLPSEGQGFSFSNIDPARVRVYQRREMSGAGRRSKDASIKIIEALYLPELPEELKAEIRSQAERILTILA